MTNSQLMAENHQLINSFSPKTNTSTQTTSIHLINDDDETFNSSPASIGTGSRVRFHDSSSRHFETPPSSISTYKPYDSISCSQFLNHHSNYPAEPKYPKPAPPSSLSRADENLISNFRPFTPSSSASKSSYSRTSTHPSCCESSFLDDCPSRNSYSYAACSKSNGNIYNLVNNSSSCFDQRGG